MKLIIDIPEETYQAIKKKPPMIKAIELSLVLFMAALNGTPLEENYIDEWEKLAEESEEE